MGIIKFQQRLCERLWLCVVLFGSIFIMYVYIDLYIRMRMEFAALPGYLGMFSPADSINGFAMLTCIFFISAITYKIICRNIQTKQLFIFPMFGAMGYTLTFCKFVPFLVVWFWMTVGDFSCVYKLVLPILSNTYLTCQYYAIYSYTFIC